MTNAFSPQTIDALATVISGGSANSSEPPIGFYRSGPKIEAFMRGLGVRMTIGSGSRVPILTETLKRLLSEGHVETIARSIEAAVDPADFIDDPARCQAVVDFMNARLEFDAMRLRRIGNKYELVDASGHAKVAGALTDALTPIDFDTVAKDLDRALENTERDPEDAVTSANAVVESVCRSIIIELGQKLPAKRDVQSLFRAVRDELGLDPKGAFRPEIVDDVKKTLGGLASCVSGIGALRTHGGDAHGKERGRGRSIDSRIARLAIHAASAVALFLIETWQLKHPDRTLLERKPPFD